jgi:hypothetical protein
MIGHHKRDPLILMDLPTELSDRAILPREKLGRKTPHCEYGLRSNNLDLSPQIWSACRYLIG